MNPSKARSKEKTVSHLFMDPEGKSFALLKEALTLSSEALASWWKNSNPTPDEREAEDFRAGLSEADHFKCLPPEYQPLYECIAQLGKGIRFNKNNFVNIHPSPILPSAIASFLVALQNPNNIVKDVSPATGHMEKECIEFIAELVGIKKPGEANTSLWGNLVSCGTLANLTAFLVACEWMYRSMHKPKDVEVWDTGIFNMRPGIVIATNNNHYSLEKCMWILGLGKNNLVKLPVAIDERRFRIEKLHGPNRFSQFAGRFNQYEYDPFELDRFYSGENEAFSLQPNHHHLEDVISQAKKTHTPIIAVALTPGTTETGTIERFDKIAIVKNTPGYEFYLHADAAIGGYALAVPEVAEKAKGIEYADSITVDAHKFGFMHYPAGAILFNNYRYREMIGHVAPYLRDLSPTIEGSRPGGPSAGCWVAHQTLGREGYANLIRGLMDKTQYLRRCLAETGIFQILHKVELNTICFSLKPWRRNIARDQINHLNNELKNRINQSGYLVIFIDDLAEIKVRNKPHRDDSILISISGIRMLVMSPYTTEQDLEEFVDRLVFHAKDLTKG